MQDLIVALYSEHATAVNVRTELVKDGLPTDRVEGILQRHKPREIYRYLPEDAGHVADRKIERAAAGRESGAPNRS